MDQAWVVAVDMGCGHQRAAYPFRDIAHEGIITANVARSSYKVRRVGVSVSRHDPARGKVGRLLGGE